jgi:hypothetical protein
MNVTQDQPTQSKNASKDGSGSKFSLKGVILTALVVLALALYASFANR